MYGGSDYCADMYNHETNLLPLAYCQKKIHSYYNMLRKSKEKVEIDIIQQQIFFQLH